MTKKSPQIDELAVTITRRANKLNIPISELCRAAGVSRRWFEYFKRRTPKAVEVYLRIEAKLTEMEDGRESKI